MFSLFLLLGGTRAALKCWLRLNTDHVGSVVDASDIVLTYLLLSNLPIKWYCLFYTLAEYHTVFFCFLAFISIWRYWLIYSIILDPFNDLDTGIKVVGTRLVLGRIFFYRYRYLPKLFYFLSCWNICPSVLPSWILLVGFGIVKISSRLRLFSTASFLCTRSNYKKILNR